MHHIKKPTESNLLPVFYIFFDIKFFLHSTEGHRPHEPVVCFLWRKGSIVFPKTPGNTSVAVWTTSIDRVGIIEVDTDSVGFFPVSEPP